VQEFIGVAKLALRDQLLTARKRLPLSVLGERARALADHLLAAPEIRQAATIAAYVSVSSEPGTGPLLDALTHAGKRVILPLVQPDKDLDWAEYAGPDALHSARFGLLEPNGPALGLDAIRGADAILVPGLAVGSNGMRLGRGAGCYDRVLDRVTPGTFVCLLLNSEEVIADVPHEDHDRAVGAVATEDGIVRFTSQNAG
jgi:5-formyltetrahydrofolate cyclo-ligase